jgi:hypothetical protein
MRALLDSITAGVLFKLGRVTGPRCYSEIGLIYAKRTDCDYRACLEC